MARILIAEDDPVISFLLEDLVAELGHETAGLGMTVASTMSLLDSVAYDVAIIDINMAGEMSYPIADALLARKIQFAFASGYAASEMPEKYQALPMLPKPYDLSRLEKVLEILLPAREM